uniref:Putative secreted protein n=1 Tax=Amblyomma triste TaxID=251400 RepID=A0A023G1F6_AMBTT
MKSSWILLPFALGILDVAGRIILQSSSCGGTCNPYENDGWCSEDCYCELGFPLPMQGYCTPAEYASASVDVEFVAKSSEHDAKQSQNYIENKNGTDDIA